MQKVVNTKTVEHYSYTEETEVQISIADLLNEMAEDLKKDSLFRKLEQRGEENLTDAELVALLLGGNKSLNTASSLLRSENGILQLRDLLLQDLAELDDIGIERATILKAAAELGFRLMLKDQAPGEKVPVTSPELAAKHLMPYFHGVEREETYVLLMDVRRQPIRCDQLSAGGLSMTIIYPRDVFRLAVRANAAFFILAHNHPSGKLVPSKDDISMTYELHKMGKMMGILLSDHLIFAGTRWSSMRQSGHVNLKD